MQKEKEKELSKRYDFCPINHTLDKRQRQRKRKEEKMGTKSQRHIVGGRIYYLMKTLEVKFLVAIKIFTSTNHLSHRFTI